MRLGRKRVGRRRTWGPWHVITDGERTICGLAVSSGWDRTDSDEPPGCGTCAARLPGFLDQQRAEEEQRASREAMWDELGRMDHIHVFGRRWVCAEEGCRQVPCAHGGWASACWCGTVAHETASEGSSYSAVGDAGGAGAAPS